MLHVIPILCLLGFFWFMEYRLSKEVKSLREELEIIKKQAHECPYSRKSETGCEYAQSEVVSNV